MCTSVSITHTHPPQEGYAREAGKNRCRRERFYSGLLHDDACARWGNDTDIHNTYVNITYTHTVGKEGGKGEGGFMDACVWV